MSGYDTYRYLIDCSLGNIKDVDFSIRPEYWERSAVLKFFETPKGGGVVRKIEGLDYLKNEPDIKHFRLNFGIGDRIENARNDNARIGFYIACSETMQKLQSVMRNVDNKFTILY